MLDMKEVENKLREKIDEMRKLGEHAGGSGHLAYRSLFDFEISDPKESQFKGKQVYEIVCKYKIYTETEFLHDPEDDELYTERYHDKFIIDKDLNIIKVEGIKN